MRKFHNLIKFNGTVRQDFEGQERPPRRVTPQEEHQNQTDRQDPVGIRPAEEASQDEEGHPSI